MKDKMVVFRRAERLLVKNTNKGEGRGVTLVPLMPGEVMKELKRSNE